MSSIRSFFSSQLTNGSNKLECYITLGWKGLLGKTTLAYWASFVSYVENELLWMRPRFQVLIS